MLYQQIDDAIQRRESWVLRRQKIIPNHVVVNGYVYEVETGYLRRPLGRLAERVNSASQMRVGA